MAINRMARKEKRKVEEIIGRAVEKSHVPGQPSLGASTTAGAVISPNIDSIDYANEEGESVRSFMLGVDALGDPTRPLSVQGRKKNYYG